LGVLFICTLILNAFAF